jgi:myo-inositol-1(or 4)-monophosphatase
MSKITKLPNYSTERLQYQKIVDFVLESGKRLVELSGKIADIGVTKQYLTEEDLRIERGLGNIIKGFGDDHILFAEEENDSIKEADDYWVVDPISGTESFVKGEGRYTIVVSHSHKGIAQFAAVYNPSIDELYTAVINQGAKLNSELISVEKESLAKPKIILRGSRYWKDQDVVEKIKTALSGYEVIQYNYSNSMAISYCDVASGKYSGVISLTRDCFPEYAGALIIKEAGGRFTNLEGSSNLNPTDRVFIGGSEEIYKRLFSLVKQCF